MAGAGGAVAVGVGEVNPDTHVYPRSTTIGDFTLTPTDVVASSNGSQTEAYTTNAGWTQVGTAITVNSGVGGKAAAVACPANADHRVHKPLTNTLPDDGFIADFDLNITALNAGSQGFPVFFSAGTAKFRDVAQDALGVLVQNPAGTLGIGLAKNNGGVIASSPVITFSLNTIYYCRMQRLSPTSIRLSVFTDANRTTHLTNSPITYAVDSTITTLNTAQHGSDDGGGTAATWEGTIDNLVVDGNHALLSIDGNTTTYAKTASEATPSLKYTLSASADKEIAEIALWIPASVNTITSLKLSLSPDNTTYTLMRTILISALTAGAWNYIRIKRDIQQNKFLKIHSDNTGILAITDIKALAPTESQWNRRQGNKDITTASTEAVEA